MQSNDMTLSGSGEVVDDALVFGHNWTLPAVSWSGMRLFLLSTKTGWHSHQTWCDVRQTTMLSCLKK